MTEFPYLTLEQARRDIEQAEAERDEARAQVAALRADNERLRGVLHAAASQRCTPYRLGEDVYECAKKVMSGRCPACDARAALDDSGRTH